MKVINRHGEFEDISFDAILYRIQRLSTRISTRTLDPALIAQKVTAQLYDRITTRELDTVSAEAAMQMSTTHPDYNTLAAHLLINDLHKELRGRTFTDATQILYDAGMLSETYYQDVRALADRLNETIAYERDYLLDYFGFKTMERGYLLRVNDKIVEKPQDMWMRVAVQIHGRDWERVCETYTALSHLWCTHATPTLFNAGTKRPQLASCFLLGTEDSIDGIFKTLADCGKISKWAGGIGVHMSNIRAKGAAIKGTGGKSSGLLPQLRIYNNVARAIDQGGKRNGSIAVYLSPDHADFEEFVDLRKNHGDPESRCRDLFLAAWIPDLFMERVRSDATWSMFSPDTAPGLDDVVGEAYRVLYERYESEGRYTKQVSARQLWYRILTAQIETGTPYVAFKDAVNLKSNQRNLGTIKSSNLCVAGETVVWTPEGNRRVDSLVDRDVTIWNGFEWSEVRMKQTSPEQEMVCVRTNEGRTLHCTPYHKFKIRMKPEDERPTEVRASDLRPGMVMWSFDRPLEFDGPWHAPNGPSFDGWIESIERTDRTGPTYCCHEPRRNMVVFNGILTGNCIEINEYSDANETAVCNLGSIALSKCVNETNGTFDFDRLARLTRIMIRNLDEVIDKTFYPIPETERSNLKHRPIGLGVQGLADAYQVLRLPFDSLEAHDLNVRIFECMYYHAVSESVRLAEEKGTYATFAGSPMSQGKFQFDLWNVRPSAAYDWEALRRKVQTVGVRNSLLIALMPTASTGQILGNNECFEPYTSNMYARRTLAGEFLIVNRHLVRDLIEAGLWNESTRQDIIRHKGSIQGLEYVPADLKNVYKTAWELRQKVLIDQAADRGPYVCQSQSMNLFFARPTLPTLNSALFYAWSRGLKTGVYYTRTLPVADAVNITTRHASAGSTNETAPQVCDSCSG